MREIEVVHAQEIPIWQLVEVPPDRILILAFVPLSVGDAVEELLGLLLLFLRKACAQRNGWERKGVESKGQSSGRKSAGLQEEKDGWF